MDEHFGKIGVLTAKQENRVHFEDIPIGEKFMILNAVNLPGFDLLAIFPNFRPQLLKDGKEPYYLGYLSRNTFKIIGSIFENPELLKS